MLASNWAVSLLVATAVTLILTPAVRRVAIRVDFVDHPSSRKSHLRTIPYGGGVAIAIATVVGPALGPFAGRRAFLLLGGAGLLCIVGLEDDRRNVGPYVRLGGQIALAVLAYLFHVRAVATGVPAVDALVTVLWIAGLTNAFNFMDNMDGLTAGSGVAAGISIFVLAALGGQYRIATIAIAMAGASLAFLAYNFRPAMIFMGDSGALFLGFLIATLTLQVAPDVAPPASFLVPLLILSVPVLDTSTVVLGRLRHGRSPLQGGKDHLSHRLVGRGFSRELAVLTLVGAELALGLLAAAIGRGGIPVGIGAVLGVGLLGGLAALAVPGHMYSSPRRALPRRLRQAVGLTVASIVLVSLPAIVALIQARGPLNVAAGEAQEAVASARSGDIEGATSLFAQAEKDFASAQSQLDGPLRTLGLAIPGLSSNIRAARVLASTGRELSGAGRAIASSANPEGLAMSNGALDLAALERATGDLREAKRVLTTSTAAVRGIDEPYLVPQARDAIDRLESELVKADRDATNGLAAAEVAPLLLGKDGERRYFLAVQNNAEARATGGFIGNFGEIVADGGRIRVDRFGRIGVLNPAPKDTTPRTLGGPEDFVARYARFGVERTWQNVNVSPDLGTVSQVIANLYPQSGGREIDGVIAIDPVGLAALLQLTGPVNVAPWPERISAANVVDVTLKQAYVRFPDEEQRAEFLGDVADSVVHAATTGSLGSPVEIVKALSPAVATGHLRIATLDAATSKPLRRLGLSGAMPASTGDSLVVTTQNAAANKVDVYLRRSITYDLKITPVTRKKATVEGTATVSLDNDLPTGDLPAAVVGPYDERFQKGENRTFLSVYSPLKLRDARLDGHSTGVETATELRRNVYSSFVSIPANERRSLAITLEGDVAMDDGWYVLDLVPQPALEAETVQVHLTVPDGWSIRDVVGLTKPTASSTALTGSLPLDRPAQVRVLLRPDDQTSLARRLLSPPTTLP
jgi:UDP-GlcNAc:undecaprenyl-phosphate GlcNAc-1-phosphate transferase